MMILGISPPCLFSIIVSILGTTIAGDTAPSTHPKRRASR